MRCEVDRKSRMRQLIHVFPVPPMKTTPSNTAVHCTGCYSPATSRNKILISSVLTHLPFGQHVVQVSKSTNVQSSVTVLIP